MNVLITGGAGFVGSHIADACLEQDYKTMIVDNFYASDQQNLPENAPFVQADITSESFTSVVADFQPDVIFHLAAQSSVPASIRNPQEDADINIRGTLNVLEAARKTGVKKVVYASTAAVYGNPVSLPIDEDHPTEPLSFYGISKFVPELYMKAYRELYGLSFTVLRYANIYGPRQIPHGEGGVVTIFVDRALRGEPLLVHGDGRQNRDFVYISDIVKANMQAITHGDGTILNIGTGRSTSINNLAHLIKDSVDQPLEVHHTDAREGDILESYFDPSAAKEKLQWTPSVDLKEGLKQTIAYYKKHR